MHCGCLYLGCGPQPTVAWGPMWAEMYLGERLGCCTFHSRIGCLGDLLSWAAFMYRTESLMGAWETAPPMRHISPGVNFKIYLLSHVQKADIAIFEAATEAFDTTPSPTPTTVLAGFILLSDLAFSSIPGLKHRVPRLVALQGEVPHRQSTAPACPVRSGSPSLHSGCNIQSLHPAPQPKSAALSYSVSLARPRGASRQPASTVILGCHLDETDR